MTGATLPFPVPLNPLIATSADGGLVSSSSDTCNRYDISSLPLPTNRVPTNNGVRLSSSSSQVSSLNNPNDVVELNDNTRNVGSEIVVNTSPESHSHIHHHVHQHHYHHSHPTRGVHHFANPAHLQITISPQVVSD